MSNFWCFGLLCVAAILECAFARDAAEVLNANIREQLKGYEKFLAEDDGTHKADLQKLIDITESALKLESLEEKQNILKNIQSNFKPEFNSYVALKLEEFQVNDDIHDAIQFYQSLLDTEIYKEEIMKTISLLENIAKETDLKTKEDQFSNLSKGFSPEFTKFLKENTLPKVNQELQNISEFFENLLVEDNLKWEAEIKELKKQVDAGLATKSVEDKQRIIYEVTNPKDMELFHYLQQKFIEKS